MEDVNNSEPFSKDEFLNLDDLENLQENVSFSDSFKICFFEMLIKNFTAVPRKFICEYLKSSHCPTHIKSSRTMKYIRREPRELIIKYFRQFRSEFCSHLTESNCVSLILNVYVTYFKQVSKQFRSKAKCFVLLYKALDICLKDNEHLNYLKDEVKKISSSLN